MSSKGKESSESSLNRDQRNLQDLEDLVFGQKKNVFLTGAGGTGKSYLIKYIHGIAHQHGIKSAITSTTGVSAHNLGGTTIHRFSGIGIGNKTASSIAHIIRTRKKDVMKAWMTTDLLIIDEVSMLGSKTLTLISDVGKIIRNTKQQPFGGLKVLFTGDFFQLPPVNDEFAFTCKTWEELNLHPIYLTTPHRYDDETYINLLLRARIGEINEEDVKLLEGRLGTAFTGTRADIGVLSVKPTVIYSLKKNVEYINIKEIEQLAGKGVTYKAEDEINIRKGCKKPSDTVLNDYLVSLDTEIAESVTLKPGAQVMLTVNLDVEEGLVNGSRGVVLECFSEELCPEGKGSSKDKDIEKEGEYVVVMWKSGKKSIITRYIHEREYTEMTVMRSQIPLILAYAFTVHKIQGCTLDCACLDLGPSIFGKGMAYVALSRVRNLSSLHLSSFDRKKIECDEEVKKFYSSL